jgi:phage shock protein A
MDRIASYVAAPAFALAALAASFLTCPEDPDEGLRQELNALKAQVASLQDAVSALRKQVGDLQTRNATL